MNIFKKIASGCESLVTKAVVQVKVGKFIADLKERDFQRRSGMEQMVGQVEDSTGTIGEVIDSLFATFGDGYKGLNNTVTLAICEQEDAIVNFVSNNSSALVKIGQAFTSLNTDINKQSVMSIASHLKESVHLYLEEEFKPKMEEDFTKEVEPKLKETGKIWGLEMKYYRMDIVDGDAVTTQANKAEYEAHKAEYLKANGKWDEEVTMFTTRQTTCIHPKK